jgi:hypothetical protein
MQSRNLLVVLAIALLLTASACSSATPEPTPTLEPTSTPEPTIAPTATPTPIPLSEIDLESILLVKGDLPTAFETGQIRSVAPEKFSYVPEPEQVISTGIRDATHKTGEETGIMILLYDSKPLRDKAYEEMVESEGLSEPLSEVGEKATIYQKKERALIVGGEILLPPTTYIKLVFTRCSALVFLNLFSPQVDELTIVTYAQRLDERLQTVACR